MLYYADNNTALVNLLGDGNLKNIPCPVVITAAECTH